MPDSELFIATAGQLKRDRSKRRLALLGVSLGLGLAWIAWMFLAHVTVYATTDHARVEVAQAVYFVEAAVSGRVKKSNLALGRQVDAGSLLVELESDPEKVHAQDEQTRHETLDAQLEDLQREVAAEERTSVAEGGAGVSATEQARAHLAEAQESAHFAREELERKQALYKQGLIPELELLRFEAAAKEKTSELQSFRKGLEQAQRQQVMASGDRQARIEALKTDIARLDGELAASSNAAEQLQRGHRILAPGRGRLGSIANLRPGAYVREGDRLAAIIPNGRLKIVAEFEPRIAIGRVKAGQIGNLRLDGFPWAEYGSVSAEVTSVGSEMHDGKVRVELDPRLNPRLALQHGLPGTLEVAIERASPIALLLQQAGGWFAGPSSAAVTPP